MPIHANFMEFEGDIVRKSDCKVVRAGVVSHMRNITEGKHLRACLRAGDYAWPGGYNIGYYTNDGGLLCPDCVRKNLRNILDSIRTDCSDGWQVTGCDAECNVDGCERCSHCNEVLFGTEEDEDGEEE